MNTRFWKGVIAAWITALLILLATHIIILQERALVEIFSLYEIPFKIFLFAIAFIAVYIMCEFLEQLKRAKIQKPLKHGALFGIVFSFGWLFFKAIEYYNIQFGAMIRPNLIPWLLNTWMLIVTASTVLAFIAAAFVYSKLDA